MSDFPDEGTEKVEQTSTTTTTDTTTSSIKEVADEITPVREPTLKVSTPAERTESKTYVSILRANPLYSEASRILHWRDPVKTGLIFGIFNFFYFLVTFGEYSLVTLVSYLLLALLSVCFVYVNYVVLRASWFQGKRVENPLREKFKDADFHISRATIDQHAQTLVDLINTTVDKLRDAFYVSNNLYTLKVAGLLYVAAVIGKWFNDSTLLYLATLGFFLWPRLYEEKHTEIDHFYGIAVTQANNYYQLGLSKIPPHIRDKVPFLKPKTQ